MFYKRNFILLFLLLAVSLAFSSELTVSYKNYSARIEYDSVSFPGQAFFVKMSITPVKEQNINIEASAELFGEKRISKANFYFIKINNRGKFCNLSQQKEHQQHHRRAIGMYESHLQHPSS